MLFHTHGHYGGLCNIRSIRKLRFVVKTAIQPSDTGKSIKKAAKAQPPYAQMYALQVAQLVDLLVGAYDEDRVIRL